MYIIFIEKGNWGNIKFIKIFISIFLLIILNLVVVNFFDYMMCNFFDVCIFDVIFLVLFDLKKLFGFCWIFVFFLVLKLFWYIS